jgi:hypothetical protein
MSQKTIKTNPDGKLWKVSLDLYVEAVNSEMAQAIAEIYSFNAQERIRRLNSNWVEDKTTKILVSGTPEEITERHYRLISVKTYNKKLLAKAFGENRAIRMLNRGNHD